MELIFYLAWPLVLVVTSLRASKKDSLLAISTVSKPMDIFQTQEEIDNANVVQEGARPGDFRFVDVNGDGVINFSDDSDKNVSSPIPTLPWVLD